MKKLLSPTLGRRALAVLIELWPIAVICGFLTADLAQFSKSSWEYYFFYQGDSLVLPLVHNSFAHHEPFLWQFSSQVFLFPEYLIYYVCHLISNSVRGSLLVNAYANVILLYVIFRVLVRSCSEQKSRIQQCFFSLLPVCLFLLFVWSESVLYYAYSSVATFFLFTTYYYGVVLAGLGVFALCLKLVQDDARGHLSKTNCGLLLGVIALIGILTTFSDPLFIMQIYLPLVASVFILWLLGRLSLNLSLAIGVSTTLAIAVGYELRHILARFVDSGVGGYIHTAKIPETITVLRTSLQQLLHSHRGTLKLTLITLLICFATGYFMYAVYCQSRSKAKTVPAGYLFIATFIVIASVTLLLGFVLTGSVTTRYLVPMTIFPLLIILTLSNRSYRFPYRKQLAYIVIAASVGLSALFTFGAGKSFAQLAEGKGYTYPACLDKWAQGSNVNGVANYYVARQLELYSSPNVFVIQATNDLAVHPWLINLGSYEHKEFSFVLVDTQGGMTAQAIVPLGQPASITDCRGYQIYNYKGTPGEVLLNQRLQVSLQQALAKAGFAKSI